jgi:chromosome transmission fidelity protein 1
VEIITVNQEGGAPDWVREFAKQERKEKLLRERTDMEARLEKIREKERRGKDQANPSAGLKAKRRVLFFLVPPVPEGSTGLGLIGDTER